MLNIDNGKKSDAKKPHDNKLTLALANKNNNLLHNSIDSFAGKYFGDISSINAGYHVAFFRLFSIIYIQHHSAPSGSYVTSN